MNNEPNKQYQSYTIQVQVWIMRVYGYNIAHTSVYMDEINTFFNAFLTKGPLKQYPNDKNEHAWLI